MPIEKVDEEESKKSDSHPLDSPHHNRVPYTTITEVIKILEAAKNGEWRWSSNPRCKYISLSIDMRGHSCVIRDRTGGAITLDELKYQIDGS